MKNSFVWAGMASLPERENLLKNAVYSIIDQVDKLYICLNNYERIPFFLYHDKIFAFIHDNTLGDAGKFAAVNFHNGYFFSLDDDLIYPPDYVSTYIKYIDNLKGLITTHGRIMQKKPLKTYYKGHKLSINCLNENKKTIKIDVPGSGVSSFHTDVLKLKLDDFIYPNMADLFLAKAAALQNVNCYCIPFAKNWLKYQNPDYEISIHARAKNNEAKQIEIINSF